jgi:hypothetical protein
MKYVNTDPGKPQKPQVIDRRGDTDNAKTLANDAYQQTMYETSNQEEGDDKLYPEIPHAAPEKGEPNTQKKLCHEDAQNVHNVPRTTTLDKEFTASTLATYDKKFAADTLATYDEEFAATLATYDEEFTTTLATYGEEFAAAAATLADMPRNTAHNIFDAKCRTNVPGMANKKET